MEMRDFFGRVLQFLVVDVPPIPEHAVEPTTVILAVIRQLNLTRQVEHPFRLCYFKDDNGAIEMVDLYQIQCIVGRIPDRNEWAIVDRNPSSVPVHI